ncbi:MAG: hypothetical protein AB7U99_12545, partial [Steroidobacteraceae bacterium]
MASIVPSNMYFLITAKYLNFISGSLSSFTWCHTVKKPNTKHATLGAIIARQFDLAKMSPIYDRRDFGYRLASFMCAL